MEVQRVSRRDERKWEGEASSWKGTGNRRSPTLAIRRDRREWREKSMSTHTTAEQQYDRRNSLRDNLATEENNFTRVSHNEEPRSHTRERDSRGQAGAARSETDDASPNHLESRGGPYDQVKARDKSTLESIVESHHVESPAVLVNPQKKRLASKITSPNMQDNLNLRMRMPESLTLYLRWGLYHMRMKDRMETDYDLFDDELLDLEAPVPQPSSRQTETGGTSKSLKGVKHGNRRTPRKKEVLRRGSPRLRGLSSTSQKYTGGKAKPKHHIHNARE
ncbi:unnamed protein product, partial [Eruca vesicaria subsp. sativa]|nr:unnamed protein product [Eruca vesicaria subsp. sativa]